jgi:hypothetical protein
MINPKIEKMAESAFRDAFGDAFNIKERKHHRLMLAYAAMLEMGAEYIQLKAFQRMFDHIRDTEKGESPLIADEMVRQVKGEKDESKKSKSE